MGGVNILWYNKLTPPFQKYSSPRLTFLFNWICGGGVNILWYNILTPPSKKYSRTVFGHGIQWQLSFKTQIIYILQTILLLGWPFFIMGCGGGVYILWYNILTPPHSKKYSRTVFVHGIQWQLSFNTQNIYISQTILIHGWHFFFMGWGGGQYIMV